MVGQYLLDMLNLCQFERNAIDRGPVAVDRFLLGTY